MRETDVLVADTSGNAFFSGTIKAEEGSLGGITLKNGSLFHKEGDNLIFSIGEDGITINRGTLGDLDLSGNLTITNGGKIVGLKNDKTVGFIINGDDGSIVANDITLGAAILSDYLRMGDNCWIFNPDAYNISRSINSESNWKENSFINVNYIDDNNLLKTAVSITKDGYIKLNSEENPNTNIVLDGQNGAIYSADTNSNTYWRIDNNSAIFNNIVARGSLQCSVLEYGEVQSVGGILLVRPSSIIKDYKVEKDDTKEEPYTYYLYLENSEQFIEGDYCKIQILNNKSYVIKIDSKDSENCVIFTRDLEIVEDLIGASIISFGSRTNIATLDEDAAEENTSSYGIGLNASTNKSLIPERALSLVNFYYDGIDIRAEDKIILGYIPNNPLLYGSIANQYGLYADNVLVKGKLISGISESSLVSGINSYSNVEIPKEYQNFFRKERYIKTSDKTINPDKDYYIKTELEEYELVSTPLVDSIDTYYEKKYSIDGKIIFWAGASDENYIESSPFWVDSYGNMFAGSGYFDGAIITKSTIEAAEIRTAVITGTGDGDFALKIRNEDGSNSKAIRFYNSSNGEEEDYFSLTKEGLTIGNTTPILLGSNTILHSYGIFSPYFRTSTDNETTIVSNSQIGFLKNSLIGMRLLDNKSLSLENNGQYILFNDDIISTVKRLSVNSEFNLWNTQFKRVQKDGITIGFDIEIEA